VLETTLTDALVEEGFLREIVSKIQTMRKEAGFEVQDHIALGCAGNGRVEALVSKNEAFIRGETLCDRIATGGLSGYEKEWDINGETVRLSVERI
jgi:isoleucyl-tRNA synthetase